MKKAILITLGVILVLIIAVVGFILWGFRYKDLGIRYDNADVQNVVSNIGITVEEPKEGEEISQTLDRLKEEGKQFGKDYTVAYSDFEHKSFEMTQSEATAMLNELMPSLFFVSRTQYKLYGGDKIEVSTSVNSKYAMDLVMPGEDISALPEYVNFAAKGSAYIKNNVIYFAADSMESPLLEYAASKINADVLTASVSTVFKYTPELYIEDMHQTEDGKISVTGMLPQKMKIIEGEAAVQKHNDAFASAGGAMGGSTGGSMGGSIIGGNGSNISIETDENGNMHMIIDGKPVEGNVAFAGTVTDESGNPIWDAGEGDYQFTIITPND